MRDIFVRLTRLDEDDAPAGRAARDTRRRVRLDDLVPAGGDAGGDQGAWSPPGRTRRLVVTTARGGEDRLTRWRWRTRP